LVCVYFEIGIAAGAQTTIDRWLYCSYTGHMKTAVSLPDQVYYAAEETARYMGISRSKLYLTALMEYLKKNNRKKTTEKLNEVYNDDYYKEFEPFANAGLECIRETTKNDTW
jgi:hypothetical protein